MKPLLTLIAALLFLQVSASGQATMMDDYSLPYLEKLLEYGRSNYPRFKYTTAKTDAAKAAYDKTKWGILDVVTLSYVYFPGNYSLYANNGSYNAALNGYQVGVFLNVGSVLEKPSIIKQAKEEYIAAKFDKQVLDMDLEQEIRHRYIVYIQESSILNLKSKAMADADDVLKTVKYKFQKGEVTFDIYNQALLSFSKYSEDKITAESQLLIAKSSLEEIVGTKLENIK